MTTAQSIIKTAQQTLQDEAGTRWAASELVAHLNDGQREIASMRPDMFTVSTEHALVLGPKQTLPSGCSKFIDVTRNSSGAVVRQADRNMLDAVDSNWYTKAPSRVIKHFCYDLREPQCLWVYPTAVVGTKIDIIYSTMPADVPAPTSPGLVWATVTGDINVNPIFNNALLNFVLFRAYAKDAEGTSNAGLSASYYQLFKAGVAEEAAPRQAVQPTPSN